MRTCYWLFFNFMRCSHCDFWFLFFLAFFPFLRNLSIFPLSRVFADVLLYCHSQITRLVFISSVSIHLLILDQFDFLNEWLAAFSYFSSSQLISVLFCFLFFFFSFFLFLRLFEAASHLLNSVIGDATERVIGVLSRLFKLQVRTCNTFVWSLYTSREEINKTRNFLIFLI